jgi:hypothetical protein
MDCNYYRRIILFKEKAKITRYSKNLSLQIKKTMKQVLIAGIIIVNLALISYSTAFFKQNRRKRITHAVIYFLGLGVIFDITSTICMIIGSGKVVTLHGLIGYSALAGMLIDTLYAYRSVRKKGINLPVTKRFKWLSATAYLYWFLAYITGVILIILK